MDALPPEQYDQGYDDAYMPMPYYPPMAQGKGLNELLQKLLKNEDLPDDAKEKLWGFLSESNALSNLGTGDVKMLRAAFRATINSILHEMPQGYTTPALKDFLWNCESAHNHLLAKAYNGSFMKALNTQFQYHHIDRPTPEPKRGFLQKLGF